jgi:hypothetical protein
MTLPLTIHGILALVDGYAKLSTPSGDCRYNQGADYLFDAALKG